MKTTRIFTACMALLLACTLLASLCLTPAMAAPPAEKISDEQSRKTTEITLDDGNRFVTYPCSESVMKPCCRMLEEIFNSPWYINLDFADLPAPTDKNRPILYRETVAESKETLPDDAERLYASAEALKEANCVLIFMELSPDVDLETTEEVSCRIWDYVDENATILWASTFTHDISYRISLIGIY